MDRAQATPNRLWWQMKLRGKFILLISGILILIFGLMAYFLVKNSRTTLTDQLNRQTEAFTTLATKPIGDNYAQYNESGTLLIKQQMQKFLELDPNVINVSVVNIDGLAQFSYTDKPISVSTEAVSSFDATNLKNSQGQVILSVEPYISDNGQHPYAVVYEISTAQIEKQINREAQTIIILSLLSLVISAVAAYQFINLFFLQPLNSIIETARVISSGRYNSRIRSRRYDEIGGLAWSIDNMADTLEADIIKLREVDKQKDEFIKIVSHNLRTPLTIIQSNTSFLNSAEMTPMLKKMVQGIEDSARRLSLFSEQILTISNFESGGEQPGLREETSLTKMLSSITQDYEELAKKRHQNFEIRVENGDAKFFTSRYQVADAVKNLLDNAIKFTPENGSITLAARIEGGKIFISVSDTGIGIKEDEIPKLFTKFHRGTETLVYNYEGTGIGLYATKLIINKLGGNIAAQSKLGEGSTFTIELPYLTANA